MHEKQVLRAFKLLEHVYKIFHNKLNLVIIIYRNDNS